jgi:hypothetical protein
VSGPDVYYSLLLTPETYGQTQVSDERYTYHFTLRRLEYTLKIRDDSTGAIVYSGGPFTFSTGQSIMELITAKGGDASV